MPWQLDVYRHAFVFERAVVTPYTFATIFLPAFLSFYAMAVLVQLPRTSFYRAALLPVVFWSSFRVAMALDFSGGYLGYAYLNQGLALGMFTNSMRSTSWVFAERPYYRLSISKSTKDTTYVHNGNTPIEREVHVSSAMWNACDLVINLRGIGWDGPQKMRFPTSYFRTESRLMFSLLSISRFIFLVLIFDTCCKFVHFLGPDTFGSPKGGTIFDLSLTSPQRYLKSSIVAFLAGASGYTMIDMVYHLHAVLFTILFRQHPSQWPPLFDSPWLSTSLTSFWGRRWHQLFRDCFLACGKPFKKYIGQAGILMVAFALSAALHDIGLRGMTQSTDTIPVVVFFLMQGVGILMETAWKRATGKRVGGLVGWLWVASWLLLWGHGLVDAWARSGLLGSEFGPEAYRPVTLLLNWISESKVEL